MDVALIVSLLSPFMPKLLELGGQAAANITDVVSEKVGEATWEKAQQSWKKLRPKVEEKPDLKVATEQLATKPDSTARQAVFQDCDSDNPPLLHQKDSMVTADYPLYRKFAKLTRQEERWGLLDNLCSIYDYRGWQKCLESIVPN